MNARDDARADPGGWFLRRVAELGLEARRGAGDVVVVTPPGKADARMRRFVLAHRAAILAAIDAPPAPDAPAAAPDARLAPPNCTAVPDAFFDVLAPSLKEGELRALIYLIRRTYGWRRVSDHVSLTQFCEGIVTKDGRRLDRGTGMGMRGVAAALKGLEERGLIVVERSPQGAHGHATNLYRLAIEGAQEGA